MIAKTNSPFFCPWQISLLNDNTLFFLNASSDLIVQSQDLSQHCPTKKSNWPVKWNLFLIFDVKVFLPLGQALMVPWRWWFLAYTYHFTFTFALFLLILPGLSYPMHSSCSQFSHPQDPIQPPPPLEAFLNWSCVQCPPLPSFLYSLPYIGI